MRSPVRSSAWSARPLARTSRTSWWAVALLLAGCFGPQAPGAAIETPDAARLSMGEFALLRSDAEGATWSWRGETPAYASLPGRERPVLETAFELPGDVPLTIVLAMEADAAGVGRAVVDAEGNVRCFGDAAGPSEVCRLPLSEPLGRTETWTARVWPAGRQTEARTFEMTLDLTYAAPETPPPVSFGHDGARAVPAAFASLRAIVRPSPFNSGEPTLGITSRGTLLVPGPGYVDGSPQTANEDRLVALRSTDEGRTWSTVPIEGGVNLFVDPWLWVDPSTDRAFRLELMPTTACSQLGVSDDDGETWRLSQMAGCAGPSGHYQKLTTGPPPQGVATTGYPSVVYYASTLLGPYLLADVLPVGQTSGVWVSPSLDGGRTWQPGALAHAGEDCGGWGGPIAVAPDGTAFSPAQFCDGVRVARSTDGGATWQEDARLDDLGHFGGLLGPSMAVDAAGLAYLVHPDAAGRAVVRWRDPASGAWSDAVDVTPPGVRATTFTLIDTDPASGSVAVAFLGTKSDPATWSAPDPTAAPDEADWHLFLVLSDGPPGPDTTWTAYQATPPDDPVQRGCIDLQGSQTSECRNLADFMDLAMHKGRPHVAFGDGCIACESAQTSRETRLGIATLIPT